jgi:hypothetical protein
MEDPYKKPKSFEETYPRYPFSPLVRLGIGLGKLLRHLLIRWRANRTAPESPGPKIARPSAGDTRRAAE